MPRTINEGFDDFHNRLKLVKTESSLVSSHRASIEACLKSNFSMKYFFKTGSIGNGTNVNGYSDTDYFAVFPRDVLTGNSKTTLIKVKEVLVERFSTTPNIRISTPAVVIPFGDRASEITEIIPVDYIKNEGGVNIYDIPDNDGGWMKSSPTAHNSYTTGINMALGFEAKPLIRFIKAWKFNNNVPISSFYLEMRVAKYSSQEKSIFYSIDIKRILGNLIDIELVSMINPSGISGVIQPCSSELNKKEVLSKLKTAYRRACKAREEEKRGNIKEAFAWWNLLFDGKFSSYYY